MTTLRILGLLLVGTLAGTPEISADMTVLQPTKAAVLPPDSSGVSKVALAFDLQSLSRSGRIEVQEAVLLWELTGLSTAKLYEFSLFELSEPWTPESVRFDQDDLTLEKQVDTWLVGPQTNEASGGILARLGLHRLADAWSQATKANYGVVVSTWDVPPDVLASQLENVRLQIWFSRSQAVAPR